jgi:hypothetical protein
MEVEERRLAVIQVREWIWVIFRGQGTDPDVIMVNVMVSGADIQLRNTEGKRFCLRAGGHDKFSFRQIALASSVYRISVWRCSGDH